MNVLDTLKKLLNIYEHLTPPLLTRLQPGAPGEQIRSAEKTLGLEFPDELRELMKFANGQASLNDRNSPYEMREGFYGIQPMFPRICYTKARTSLTDYAWWAGLEDLVEMTQLFREEIEQMEDAVYEEIGPARCHANMIVFALTENASSLMVDLAPKPGGTVGQVVMVATQPTIVAVLAPSLKSFLTFLIDGFTSGLFSCDDPGYGFWCDSRWRPPANLDGGAVSNR